MKAAGASRWRRVAGDQELLLLVLLGLLLVAVAARAPEVLTVDTLFNVARESMVTLVFAVAVLIVIISGGIDVSFLAVGIFAAYSAVSLVPQEGPAATAWLPFAVAVAIGVALGLVNAAVVLGAGVSTLIATLATSAVFLGVLFAFVGGTVVNSIPEPLRVLGSTSLLELPAAGRGTTRLSVLVLPVLVVCAATAAFLRWTVAGRSIFAMGGDREAARRAGVAIGPTVVLVFALSGALAGLAGMTHVALSGRADPTTFFGGELNVLAAVVLGGALISGGRGSVRGTVLGVLLITCIRSSLIPLGIPPVWQEAVIGSLLILGVVLQALASRVKPVRAILDPADPVLAPAPLRRDVVEAGDAR